MPEVRVITSLQVTAGSGDDYAREWSPEYENVNGQPGCIQFELFRNVREPERFVRLEHWESRGSFFSAWLNNVMRPVAGGSLIEGEPQTEIYFRRKLYLFQPEGPAPADGQRVQEDIDRVPGHVRVVANFNALPGMADSFVKAWLASAENDAGCLQRELFHSTRNPDHVALLALWEDRDAFDAHIRLAAERTYPEFEFAGAPDQRKVGQSGLEIYFKQQIYVWDGDDWKPVEG